MPGKKAQRRLAREAAAQARDAEAAREDEAHHEALRQRYAGDSEYRASIAAEVERRRQARGAFALVLSLAGGYATAPPAPRPLCPPGVLLDEGPPVVGRLELLDGHLERLQRAMDRPHER